MKPERIPNIADTVVSPPIPHGLYGCALPRFSRQWLHSLQGDSPIVVWLGHGNDESGILVGTVPAETFDNNYIPAEKNRTFAAATLGRDQLVNVIGPERPDPPSATARTVQHIDQAIADCENWPVVEWKVDSKVVAFRLWRFAGTWLAICSHESVRIVVVGVRVGADEIDLKIVNNHSYGVDFDTDITISDLRRASPDNQIPIANPKSLHRDQLELLQHPHG